MKLIQSGPSDAKIMLVGETPTSYDRTQGKPFTAGTGSVLDTMLNRAGINRAHCFVTNIVHDAVPANRLEAWMKPVHPQLIQGILQLKADIERVKPNVVVGLGANALKILTGKQGIDKWRGSILDSTLVPGQKVISTYSPGHVIRTWDYKAVAEMDFHRIKGDSEFPELRLPEREYLLDPPGHIRTPVADEMCKAEWLSIDIECTYDDLSGDWKLRCVGFSDHAGRAMVISCDSPSKMWDIRRLCASDSKKVFQNGMFDVTVLERDEGIMVKNFAWDTMLAHHSLYTECASGSDEMSALAGKKRQAAIAKGLAFISSIYTREPYYKDDGKLWKEDNDINLFYLYNGRDAAVTREIRDKQEVDLNEAGLMPVLEHEMSMVRPLLAAMWRGIKIDTDRRTEVNHYYETEILRLQALLDALAGGPLNVKSSPQIKAFLYDKLGLPPQKKRGTGTITADKDAIVALAAKHSNPGLLTILEIRERRDMQERYVNVPIDPDGRMRCSIDITGTQTGRLASRKSIRGTGTNLQNIPTRKAIGQLVKECFVADEGKVFVQRDYKQAEAVVVAYEAMSDGLIELFEDPTRDVHKENAARIFNKKIDDITGDERYLAKRVVHASNYGMGAFRLMQLVNQDAASTGLRIAFRDAEQLIELYFMIYPEIKEIFWHSVERQLQHERALTNSFGRKRWFFGRWDEELLRVGYAYRPQSTVGDLCGKAVVRAFHDVELGQPEWGAEFLMTVHDSILYQVDKKYMHECAEAIEDSMKIPVTVNGRTFIIPSDCDVGFNWSKKTATNNNGLIAIEKFKA